MNSTMIRLLATYFILLLATSGFIALLVISKGDETQVWAALFLIIGALVRDLASIQSAQSSDKIAENAVATEVIRAESVAK